MPETYRTIVADPPWPMPSGGSHTTSQNAMSHWWLGSPSASPYLAMDIEAIAGLGVSGLAEKDAHLYLWTVNHFVRQAYEVAEQWGFRPTQLLTWAKAPRGIGLGGVFTNSTEFILFCRRGSLAPLRRMDSTWWQWKRPYDSRGPIHSAKPDAFLDLVEQTSPGPYLELFARRARFGWDYWGDESLGTVEMPEVAA